MNFDSNQKDQSNFSCKVQNLKLDWRYKAVGKYCKYRAGNDAPRVRLMMTVIPQPTTLVWLSPFLIAVGSFDIKINVSPDEDQFGR